MKKITLFFLTALLVLGIVTAPRIKARPRANSCPPQYANDDYACSNWIAGQTALLANSEQPSQNDTPPFSVPQTNNPWGRLWLASQLQLNNPGSCVYTAHISWMSQHASDVQVTVMDNQSGSEKSFANGASGGSDAAWFVPGQSYRFRLWNAGRQQILDQMWVSADGLGCTNPQSTVLGASVTAFSVSSNNQFCVGQTPTYTVHGGLANTVLTWNSSGPSGSNQRTAKLDGSGNFTGDGWQWTQADAGPWTKSATINGITKTLNFTVSDCGNSSYLP